MIKNLIEAGKKSFAKKRERDSRDVRDEKIKNLEYQALNAKFDEDETAQKGFETKIKELRQEGEDERVERKRTNAIQALDWAAEFADVEIHTDLGAIAEKNGMKKEDLRLLRALAEKYKAALFTTVTSKKDNGRT